MCKCTPTMRTPFCGKGDCEWPESEPREWFLIRKDPDANHVIGYTYETMKKTHLHEHKFVHVKEVLKGEVRVTRAQLAKAWRSEVAGHSISKKLADESGRAFDSEFNDFCKAIGLPEGSP